MSEENRYVEGQHNGRLVKGSLRTTDEALRASEQVREREIETMIEEAQLQAREEEERRIAQMNGISETDRFRVGNLMKDYAEENRYNEYLVHGAILTCSNATTDIFVLPDKKEIALDRSMDETARCRMALNVEGNPASTNELSFATVGDTVINENIFPFNCNCMMTDVSREEAEAIANDPECRRFGVCRHLIRLNEKWDNMPRQTGYMKLERQRLVSTAAGVEEILGESDSKMWVTEEEEGITMTSILFCRRGGLISPITSGQKIEEKVEGISREALRALMELEVLGPYAEKHGYLVTENGTLVGIRPHLAGDGYVTFGFGDAIQSGDELKYYQDAMNAMGYNVELSMSADDYEKIKNIVIPVEICFEKLINDTAKAYTAINNYFEGVGYKLSQNEMDALIIARYQLGSLAPKIRDTVTGEGGREAFYDALLEAHGGSGYESRTTVEINIFYEGNYYVENGSHDVIVEPLVDWQRQ